MNALPYPALPASVDPREHGPAESLPADDHRRLGRELDLFASDPLLPAGMPVWLPAGAVIRGELERYVVEVERAAGYAHVYSPPLGKKAMYEISGHWEHYAEAMFPPIEDGGSGPIVLRPMNCPHHIVAYRSRPRSWRELPLRIAELGAMFRNEPSGSLSGLSRVRAMVLNDAHHFCDPARVAEEVALVVGLIEDAYAVLGLAGHSYRLSLRGDGDKYGAEEARWDRAEEVLAGVLDDLGVAYEPVRGEGAFYGPKIDVQMPGRGRREESFSSVQLDFLLPQRFDLRYAGPDGPRRPVVLHRSVLSSMERCLAFLLEQHGGNLPVWLAPVQAVVLPVDASSAVQARAVVEVVDAARAAGLRVDVDDAAEPLGARIRRARLARVPYRVVVGEREAAAGQVAVDLRDGRRLDPMPPQRFVAVAARVAAGRSRGLWS
ncbi:threonine--tRNA ligase [Geodermatophilus sp. SYSU D00705]